MSNESVDLTSDDELLIDSETASAISAISESKPTPRTRNRGKQAAADASNTESESASLSLSASSSARRSSRSSGRPLSYSEDQIFHDLIVKARYEIAESRNMKRPDRKRRRRGDEENWAEEIEEIERKTENRSEADESSPSAFVGQLEELLANQDQSQNQYDAEGEEFELPVGIVDQVERVLGDRVRAEDGSIEYLVKWRNRSFLHCQWLDSAIMQRLKTGKRSITTWRTRMQNSASDTGTGIESTQSPAEEELPMDLTAEADGGESESAAASSLAAYFNPRYLLVDRVIAREFDDDGKEYFLVKWCDLGYDECYWEMPEDIKQFQPQIDRYFALSTDIPPAVTSLRAPRRFPRVTQITSLVKKLQFKDDRELRSYQIEGVQWLGFNFSQRRNSLLADEMGLGKTVQIVAFLKLLQENSDLDRPILIIAPLSTLPHWRKEFESWTDMNVLVYHALQDGRKVLRDYEFDTFDIEDKLMQVAGSYKFNVLITSPDIAMTDSIHLSAIPWRVAVIDEAHRLKNRESKLTQILHDSYQWFHLVLLTGTPLQNNCDELFTLLNFLDPIKFSNADKFLAKFGSMDSAEQVEALHAELKPFLLRRMKVDVEKSLPPAQETLIEVELTQFQKSYYRAVYEQNIAVLANLNKNGLLPKLLNVAIELKKVCAHPYLLKGVEDSHQITIAASSLNYDQEFIRSAGKFVLLSKLLPKLKNDGHRVLIFSVWTRVLDLIEHLLAILKLSFERIVGSIRGSDRQKSIENFCESGSGIFCMLLTNKAGGVGLNLMAADTVIMFDSDANPQNDVQAMARSHRIGQTKKVQIFRLVTRGTYEQEMFQRAAMKLGLDRAVFHQNHHSDAGAAMNKSEVTKLLRLGAFHVFNEAEETKINQLNEDEGIDQILARNSRIINYSVFGDATPAEIEGNGAEGDGNESSVAKPKSGSSLFAKASFVTGSGSDIDLNAPDFWERLGFNIDEEAVRLAELPIVTGNRRRGLIHGTYNESELNDASGFGRKLLANQLKAARKQSNEENGGETEEEQKSSTDEEKKTKQKRKRKQKKNKNSKKKKKQTGSNSDSDSFSSDSSEYSQTNEPDSDSSDSGQSGSDDSEYRVKPVISIPVLPIPNYHPDQPTNSVPRIRKKPPINFNEEILTGSPFAGPVRVALIRVFNDFGFGRFSLLLAYLKIAIHDLDSKIDELKILEFCIQFIKCCLISSRHFGLFAATPNASDPSIIEYRFQPKPLSHSSIQLADQVTMFYYRRLIDDTKEFIRRSHRERKIEIEQKSRETKQVIPGEIIHIKDDEDGSDAEELTISIANPQPTIGNTNLHPGTMDSLNRDLGSLSVDELESELNSAVSFFQLCPFIPLHPLFSTSTFQSDLTKFTKRSSSVSVAFIDQQQSLHVLQLAISHENGRHVIKTSISHHFKPVTAHWDADCDRDLLLGVYFHGYCNYSLMAGSELLEFRNKLSSKVNPLVWPPPNLLTRRFEQLITILQKNIRFDINEHERQLRTEALQKTQRARARVQLLDTLSKGVTAQIQSAENHKPRFVNEAVIKLPLVLNNSLQSFQPIPSIAGTSSCDLISRYFPESSIPSALAILRDFIDRLRLTFIRGEQFVIQVLDDLNKFVHFNLEIARAMDGPIPVIENVIRSVRLSIASNSTSADQKRCLSAALIDCQLSVDAAKFVQSWATDNVNNANNYRGKLVQSESEHNQQQQNQNQKQKQSNPHSQASMQTMEKNTSESRSPATVDKPNQVQPFYRPAAVPLPTADQKHIAKPTVSNNANPSQIPTKFISVQVPVTAALRPPIKAPSESTPNKTQQNPLKSPNNGNSTQRKPNASESLASSLVLSSLLSSSSSSRPLPLLPDYLSISSSWADRFPDIALQSTAAYADAVKLLGPDNDKTAGEKKTKVALVPMPPAVMASINKLNAAIRLAENSCRCAGTD